MRTSAPLTRAPVSPSTTVTTTRCRLGGAWCTGGGGTASVVAGGRGAVLERPGELVDVLVARACDVQPVAEVVEVQRALLAELGREDRQHALADHGRLDQRRRIDPDDGGAVEERVEEVVVLAARHGA